MTGLLLAAGFQAALAAEPLKILFVGNRYTYARVDPATSCNAANAHWDPRGNIAKTRWDVVVPQEQSDASPSSGRGANANHPQFSAYADKIQRFVHVGTAGSYRERALYTSIYGSVATCVAAGWTQASCDNNTLRTNSAKRRLITMRQHRQRRQVGAEAAEPEHRAAQQDGRADACQLGRRQSVQAAASRLCPGATRVKRTGSRVRSSSSPRWRTTM